MRGMNINITLLFSIPSYEAVAQAYIRALDRRHAEGKPVRSVASVASFFLSRIDVLVDRLLQQRIQPEDLAAGTSLPAQLLGRVAVANASSRIRASNESSAGIAGRNWRHKEPASSARSGPAPGRRIRRIAMSATSSR
jgi:transketolase